MTIQKILAAALCAALLSTLTACGGGEGQPVSHIPPEPQETLMEITLTAGKTQLRGVLYDNDTARAFARLLPLDTILWDPAPGFARAFNLPERIPDAPERTRWYELGSLAYWDEGPSIAIIYNDNREETVVPVTSIGRLDGDVEIFFDYDQSIRIEQVKPEKASENAPSKGGDTVLTALPNPRIRQTFYLWEEGKAPAVTRYTSNPGGYFDEPDFRPTVTMNGSFLAEGLIDEVSLVVAPVADGNIRSVSSFERYEFLPSQSPAAFSLLEAKRLSGDGLWLRYRVKGEDGR